ncbi:uncharacterized protein LOC134290517 [Aedes albopictus]|uniref:PHD-type domain-containing protein n=1 Tax=Aedes albopictus TaxID=7160 RepID=A0ABM1ZXL5_AEDAL
MGSTSNPKDCHNCGKCNRSDSANNMVGCDLCETWVHYDCAGVTDSIADPERSWKCEKCLAELNAKPRSQKSGTSRTSGQSGTSQRQQLQLQLLEEQRKLRLKHQEEEYAARKKAAEEEEKVRKERMEEECRYLKEKFELLLAGSNENDSPVSRDRASAAVQPVATTSEGVTQSASTRQAPPNSSSTPQFSHIRANPSGEFEQRTSISRIPMDISEFAPGVGPRDAALYQHQRRSLDIRR